jgi:2-oxoglutarate ferredoxin oxidoreductase subunit beta
MKTLKRPFMQEEANHFCAGCGHGIVNRIIAEVVEEFGYEKKSILTLGVGCACNMNFSWGGDKLQCAHGRASAVVTGIKVAKPDVLAMSYQGDGDAYVIGIAETLNAAYRNSNVTVFVINNNNFAMTGGQMSWTTLPDQKTTTSIKGRDIDSTGTPMKVPEMMATFDYVGYVARGSVHSVKEINALKKYVRSAIEAQIKGEGYSMVEILAPCPTNWGLNMEESLKWMEEEVLPHYPTGELLKRKGDR